MSRSGEGRPGTLNGLFSRREGHHVIDVEPNTDFFADRMVMVAGNQSEHPAAAVELERVQNLGAAKRLVKDCGLQVRTVVVNDVVRTQQPIDTAAPVACVPADWAQRRG